MKLFPEFENRYTDLIKSGKIMAYRPFRATLGFNVYGVWADAFTDLEFGVEYYPNLPKMAFINHKFWFGLRGMYGLKTYSEIDEKFNLGAHSGAEILFGMNPLRKSFDFNGFDPYVGLKYKIFKTYFADSGPGIFLGLNVYGFFSEFAVIYGKHAARESMNDPTVSPERVAFGFTGFGMHFGYRFILNKLAI